MNTAPKQSEMLESYIMYKDEYLKIMEKLNTSRSDVSALRNPFYNSFIPFGGDKSYVTDALESAEIYLEETRKLTLQATYLIREIAYLEEKGVREEWQEYERALYSSTK